MKKVTFVKIIGVLFLVASLILIFLSLSISAMAPVFSGVVIFIISILFLTNPSITYDDEKIQQRNLFGMAVRTHYFATDNLTTRDNQIYKAEKRLKLSNYMLVASEFNALVEHVKSKEGEVTSSLKRNDDLLDSEI